MNFFQHFQFVSLAILGVVLYMIYKLVFLWWILPNLAYGKLRANGFSGPTPSFPFGNLNDMKKKGSFSSLGDRILTHDIHSTTFPYFSLWQKSYGKVFTYWLGTEPFLYIADPEFLKKMSKLVLGKNWGKPRIFRSDRFPMFGNGLNMLEGDDWVHHRHVITPAFSPANLKAMSKSMMESANNMLDRWTTLINSGKQEIDVEKEIIHTAGEIIAKASFGISYENGEKVFEKLSNLQMTLFNSNRYIGVPFSKYMCLKQDLKAKRLGKEIDSLLASIIDTRKKSNSQNSQQDLLSLLLAKNDVDGGNDNRVLTTRELVDECKTFFFGGHETTALALSWTLLLLAMHQDWQDQLREEIKQVIGDQEIDPKLLNGLKKMGWVMNEILRLYPPSPNTQRQAREDIQVDNLTIPKGTNMWIDLVAMHHDKELWGDDVNEFKPERFQDDNLHGGCKHKMGFSPFGFGGRMCVARNLATMEYKVVLTMILTKFSLCPSPNYCHSPKIMLSLRPSKGLQIILKPLSE